MSWRSAFVLRELSGMSQRVWGVSNAKNMDTTGKPVKDNRYMPNTMKRTRPTWRKIAWSKLDVQTAHKISRLTQNLAMFTKKKRKYLRWNTREMCSSIVGTCMGESSYVSVARRANTTNQDNKYGTLVEKLIQLEATDWPKFQEHLKNYTRPNFTKHQLSKKLGIGRDPMLK